MKIDYRMQGDTALLKKLKTLRGDVGKAVEKELTLGAKAIQSAAKQLCPVDTGRLRNSIVTEKVGQTAVSIGTKADYAVFVEFGAGPNDTPAVRHSSNEKEGDRGGKGNFFAASGQKPQPFLASAFRQNEAEIKNRLDSAVKKALGERSAEA